KQIMFTGTELSPADGYRLGLVNELCEPGGALTGALALAAQITANSPVSVQQSLQAIDALASADDALGWELTAKAKKVINASADAKEGVAAFFEKRPPKWTGR
ncbi:MAG: enoyl-CoA hydratase, partial [Porticoccaceae bacterium]